eukprot:6744106-Prymnesium_polylepis.1
MHSHAFNPRALNSRLHTIPHRCRLPPPFGVSWATILWTSRTTWAGRMLVREDGVETIEWLAGGIVLSGVDQGVGRTIDGFSFTSANWGVVRTATCAWRTRLKTRRATT